MAKKHIGKRRIKVFGYVRLINRCLVSLFAIAVLVYVVAFIANDRKKETLPRIEDMCDSSAAGNLPAFAISYDYVVKTFGSHVKGDDWVCDQYDIMIRGIHEEEFRLVETVDTSWMHVYSDGTLFYILVSDYLSGDRYYEQSARGCAYPFDLGVGVLDPETMQIDWHKKLYFDIRYSSGYNIEDTLLAGDKLCLIFSDEIYIYDTKNKIKKIIYTADVPLINDLWYNHAAFYDNQIYVMNENRDLIAVNIETGEATTVSENVHYSEDSRQRHQYYIYGNELWRKTRTTNKMLLDGSMLPVQDEMKYSHIIYKNESEVYLEWNIFYFRYVPDTKAYYLIDRNIDLMELMINDVIQWKR